MKEYLNRDPRRQFTDLSPRKGRKTKETLMEGPWADRLSRSRLIENLLMVSNGIRKASMFHPRDMQEMIDVHSAASAIGVGMVTRRAGRRVYKVFLFGEERSSMARSIPDLDETMGEREFIIAQITIANFTGAFLDLPKCCIDDFVRNLMNATDQDAIAMEELWACPEPDPRAYFVERFVPCHPLCENAIAEGERIERSLGETDPDLLLEYLNLREEHMIDVREGRIVEEKRERDLLLGLYR